MGTLQAQVPHGGLASDAAVSRASREMTKRLLCVTSVWKVKALQWQLGTSRSLGTEEPDDEQPEHQDWETYLDRLFALLLAYALGGIKALDNAGGRHHVVRSRTTRGRTLASLPHANRLAWLQQRDTEERADWVSAKLLSQRGAGFSWQMAPLQGGSLPPLQGQPAQAAPSREA